MKVCVLGLGYVGSVTSAMLADSGHSVVGIDIDHKKVDMINKGMSPVSEPKLSEIIKSGIVSGNLSASSDINVCHDADCIFICVGTPFEDGAPDFSQIKSVLLEINSIDFSVNQDVCVLNRSTCLPDIHQYAYDLFLNSSNIRKINYLVHPEFLREGSAIKDFLNPPVYIFGSDLKDEYIDSLVTHLYGDVSNDVISTTISDAALTKYASNAFHALKVSFANEIGSIAESIGGNALNVMNMLCQDKVLNISDAYLKPGLPYGGSCLPKDLATLVHFSKSQGMDLPLLASISQSNFLQIENLKELILSSNPKSVAILGVAFKSDTDDIRNSPIISLTNLLVENDVEVKLWDDNLDVNSLIGANLRVISHSIPDLGGMLAESLEMAIKDAEVLLLAHNKYLKELENMDLNEDLLVVDAIGLLDNEFKNQKGIFW